MTSLAFGLQFTQKLASMKSCSIILLVICFEWEWRIYPQAFKMINCDRMNMHITFLSIVLQYYLSPSCLLFCNIKSLFKFRECPYSGILISRLVNYWEATRFLPFLLNLCARSELYRFVSHTHCHCHLTVCSAWTMASAVLPELLIIAALKITENVVFLVRPEMHD